MRNGLLTLFLLAIVISGCKQKDPNAIEYRLPDFESREAMRYEVVNDTLILPGMIRFMDVYKDYLIMVYRNVFNEQFLHIHDKRTGERIKSNLYRGRGPNEIFIPEFVNFNNETGELSIWEQNYPGIRLIQIDSLLADRFEVRMTTDTLLMFPNIETVFPLGDNRYLTRLRDKDGFEYRRFMVIDNDELIGRFEEYPIGRPINDLVYDFTKLPVSPDKTKFAIGTSSGAILEFFDISDGIKRTGLHYFFEPIYQGDGHGMSTASGYGFMDMACDDRYVYGTFGAPGDSDLNNIAIFDWEGKPVKLLSTKDYMDFYPIAVDRSDGDIYAVARAYEGEIHIIRIKPF